ncbi:MAG: hypothetical protein V1778_01330 [bacterium]
MKRGTWKKERATGRKFSKSDEHPVPAARTRSKYWVGDYKRGGKKVKGSFRSNPGFHRKR